MPTIETLQQTRQWLDGLQSVHGYDGVIHEVSAVLVENANFSAANHRYRKQLADTVTILLSLYDATGQEKLLDASRDIRRLIEWADSGLLPLQLALFAMPESDWNF